MGRPAHFPNGLSTVAGTKDLALFKLPNPVDHIIFWDDFYDFDASAWVVTSVDTDGDGSEANATASGAGGLLVLATEADELDREELQWAGEESSAVVEFFAPGDTKRFFMKTRFKVSDATDTAVIIGACVTDTTLAAVADGIYFRKADTSTTLELVVEKNSTESTISMGAMADDTFVVASMSFDAGASGKDTPQIKAYLNDVHVGTITTAANLPDDVTLAPSIAVNNGAEGSEDLTIDYLFIAQDR